MRNTLIVFIILYSIIYSKGPSLVISKWDMEKSEDEISIDIKRFIEDG